MLEELVTPRGGILNMVDSYRYKGKKRFKVVCSVCSKDTELCPKPFDILSFELLKRGAIPCLCSKKPNYTQDQKLIILRRLCEEKGYKLINFPNRITMQGRLGIFNPSTKSYWRPNVNDFWNNRSNDPALLTHSLNKVENTLHKLNKVTGDNITNVINYKGSWLYECKVCSYDEYVQAGLCSGKFETKPYKLTKGQLSCRCRKYPRWTSDQRDFQIRKKLADSNADVNFKWVEGSYRNIHSRFMYTASCGHLNTSNVGNFLRSKAEICSVCNSHRVNNKNGYYPNRQEEDDVLYVVKLSDTTFKVGRSFKTRCKYRINLLKKECEGLLSIVKTYQGSHKDVYEVEQSVLKSLDEKGARVILDYTKEAFSASALSEVIQTVGSNCKLQEVDSGLYK